MHFHPGENEIIYFVDKAVFTRVKTHFHPGENHKIDNLIFTRVKTRFHLGENALIYKISWKMRTFKAFFGIEGPLQTCGPELKTKLHDPFEPFLASYHVLLVNRVSEVIFINSFISYAQIRTTFKVARFEKGFVKS